MSAKANAWMLVAFSFIHAVTGRQSARGSRLMVISALTLLGLGSQSSPPPPLQEWFIEHLEVGRVALPTGVSLEVVTNTDYRSPAEFLVITNSSPTFLYLLVTEPPTLDPMDNAFEGPPGLRDPRGLPLYRVAADQAEDWDLTSDEAPWQWGWTPIQEYGPSNALKLYVYRDRLVVAPDGLDCTVIRFETQNRFDSGRDRPDNVELPQPQLLSVPAVYNGEAIDIPLIVSYTLNDDYHAVSNLPMETLIAYAGLLACLMLGAVLAGLTWPIRKIMLRNFRKHQASSH